MKKYEIFLLDADDTLFDFSACCKNALKRATVACGFSYREEYHKLYLAINDEMWRKLERKEITHEELFRTRFKAFLAAVGESDEKGDELNREYVAALTEECVPFPGAETFLKELLKRGKIYIVTNGTASVQRGRFKKFELEKYVSGVFISEDVGAYKPSIDYFSYVAAHIPAFDKQKSVLIGDSLTSDIAMACAADVDCVWLNFANRKNTGKNRPTYIAASYEEVLKTIDEM